jgi:acetyltransferase-like isoleucine patch superfamily enzyme
VLGDDVWLGAHVVVLPGSHLADGTVVGSNAVIRATTQPGEVWAGVPAHKIGERTPG